MEAKEQGAEAPGRREGPQCARPSLSSLNQSVSYSSWPRVAHCGSVLTDPSCARGTRLRSPSGLQNDHTESSDSKFPASGAPGPCRQWGPRPPPCTTTQVPFHILHGGILPSPSPKPKSRLTSYSTVRPTWQIRPSLIHAEHNWPREAQRTLQGSSLTCLVLAAFPLHGGAYTNGLSHNQRHLRSGEIQKACDEGQTASAPRLRTAASRLASPTRVCDSDSSGSSLCVCRSREGILSAPKERPLKGCVRVAP